MVEPEIEDREQASALIDALCQRNLLQVSSLYSERPQYPAITRAIGLVLMEMQNTDITFDVRGSRVEEGYLPQRDSEAELNEYNRQTDEEIAALAAAFGGRFKEEGYGEE